MVFSENLKFTIRNYKNRTRIEYKTRPVVPGGAGGAMAPPDFGRSVNPISTRWGRLCPPNNIGTPGFSDLPTALKTSNELTLLTFVTIVNMHPTDDVHCI